MKWNTVNSFINLGTVDVVSGLVAIAFQAGGRGVLFVGFLKRKNMTFLNSDIFMPEIC